MENIEVIATEVIGSDHYVRAVLRDDQMEQIRQIVREEIRAALPEPRTNLGKGWEPF